MIAVAEATPDLVTYAKLRRLRIRNLHDGRPVPPCSVDRRKRRMVERLIEPFRSGNDRCDAIVGAYGYVFALDGRLEWYLRRQIGLAKVVDGLRQAGCTVEQEGDDEAAGFGPWSAIEAVLRAIKPTRTGSGNPNPNRSGLTANTRRSRAPESTQSAQVDHWTPKTRNRPI